VKKAIIVCFALTAFLVTAHGQTAKNSNRSDHHVPPPHPPHPPHPIHPPHPVNPPNPGLGIGTGIGKGAGNAGPKGGTVNTGSINATTTAGSSVSSKVSWPAAPKAAVAPVVIK